MNKLRTIGWLAVLVAVIPFLAVPLWLTKLLLVVLAVAIFATAAFAKYQDPNTSATYQLDASAQRNEAPDSAAGENKDAPNSAKNKNEPADITKPDTDRVARYNSYSSRSKQLNDN